MGWGLRAPHTGAVTSGRWLRLTFALLLVLATLGTTRASGADTSRCAEFRADSISRARQVTGSGERVVVIGDSWSAGLGLAEPAGSWPRRLPGRVHVAGFSGSGFSAWASPCGAVSFAARAKTAVGDADLVVVQGGLNDWDRSRLEIRDGFTRLMRVLHAADAPRVVVVGPASAPSRAAKVPYVDRLLARLSARVRRRVRLDRRPAAALPPRPAAPHGHRTPRVR